MKYKGNVYSYFNLSGILFCIFIAWASYYNYKNLQITGLLAFFVFCVLKCAMLAKFKKDILEKVIVLSEAQNGILAAAEFDENAFRENIDEKAELIDKIERLDDGFNSLFTRVKETLDGHKDEYKSEITVIKELIKSVTELAVRVQAQEARNKVLAENRFAQMRKEVSNAKRNTQAASTYYNSMNKLNFEPHLMDQKK